MHPDRGPGADAATVIAPARGSGDKDALVGPYPGVALSLIRRLEGRLGPFESDLPLARLQGAPTDEGPRPRPRDLELDPGGLMVAQHLSHQRSGVHKPEVRRGVGGTSRRWTLGPRSPSGDARPLGEVAECLAAKLPLLLAERRPLLSALLRIGAKLSSRVSPQFICELRRVLGVRWLVEGHGSSNVRRPSSRKVQGRGPRNHRRRWPPPPTQLRESVEPARFRASRGNLFHHTPLPITEVRSFRNEARARVAEARYGLLYDPEARF